MARALKATYSFCTLVCFSGKTFKVTHGDNLLGDQSCDQQQIISFSTDTKEESDGVEAVSKDGLKSKKRTVDIEVSSPPSHKTIDETDKGDDTKQRSNDTQGDLDTEHSTIGEGVKDVFSLVVLVDRDRDGSSGESLFSLGVSQFGDGEGSGDGHDTGRNEDLGIETETNVSNKNGSRDGSETTSHDLVDLGFGHVGNERSDQHG